MSIIDPSSNLGRVRLSIGDTSDIPVLPDSVILQVLTDSNQNLNKAISICAVYVLASLSRDSHIKLQYMEIWKGEGYRNYKDFLTTVIKNPSFSTAVLSPYSGSTTATDVYGQVATEHPLIRMIRDFNAAYVPLTQSEAMHNISSSSVS